MKLSEHKARAEEILEVVTAGVRDLHQWVASLDGEVPSLELSARYVDINTTLAWAQVHATLANCCYVGEEDE